MGNSKGWTPERREKQAAAIRQWKPWEKSTGPKSDEGKAISARNAYAGDAYHEIMKMIRGTRASADMLFRRRSGH